MNKNSPATNFTVKDLEPDWKMIGKPNKVTLRDAILYSLNISPDWEGYQRYIDDTKLALKINFEYAPKLKLAIDWALEAGYLVELKPTHKINELDLVYLEKFIEWALKVQSWDIPEELKLICGFREVYSRENGITLLNPEQWNPIAEELCAEFIRDGVATKLDHIAELIVDKFKSMGVKFAKGEMKANTVKRYLSDEGRFTAIRRANSKK